ncbi:ribonuclease H-like domain-containing protein [Tanacetum coccineum]
MPRPTDANIVYYMWLFCHKYLADGTLSRYNAHLIANDSMQLEVHQLDVKNPFLYGDLSKTVYMHQPLRAWFQHFAAYITRAGFASSRCDSSLFTYRPGIDIAYLLLYVDDIVLTTSSQILLKWIITSLHQEFSMTDLGSLNYLLGIFVTRDSSGMFLSHRKCATEILEQAHMANCNLSRTPVDTKSKLRDDVQQVCLYMHDPREHHFSALKQILRYVCGTLDHGLHAEAEYRGVAETCWLRNLLHELHTPLSSAMLVYCDNVNVVYLSSNLIQHQRTKHIEIDIHFFQDLVAAGQVRVLHVPSRYQYADIFNKGLLSALFEEFRTSLSV